jgi:hypothetical protein
VTSPVSSSRARPARAAVVAVVVLAALGAACGSKSSARPTTPAKLAILAPAPGAVTGSSVDLRMAVTHASLATATGTAVDPAKGFIHVSVDGHLVGITSNPNQVVSHLTSGPHTIEAQFVASDHRPFANAVTASVSITVR